MHLVMDGFGTFLYGIELVQDMFTRQDLQHLKQQKKSLENILQKHIHQKLLKLQKCSKLRLDTVVGIEHGKVML